MHTGKTPWSGAVVMKDNEKRDDQAAKAFLEAHGLKGPIQPPEPTCTYYPEEAALEELITEYGEKEGRAKYEEMQRGDDALLSGPFRLKPTMGTQQRGERRIFKDLYSRQQVSIAGPSWQLRYTGARLADFLQSWSPIGGSASGLLSTSDCWVLPRGSSYG